MSKRKAANGNGTISKRADGQYEGRYVVGYDPGTGKQIRKSVYGKTQTECAKKLREAINAVEYRFIYRANEDHGRTVAGHLAQRVSGQREAVHRSQL